MHLPFRSVLSSSAVRLLTRFTSVGVVSIAPVALISTAIASPLISPPLISPMPIAQTSYYYTGQSADGQRLLVDLNSIDSVGDYDANFSYLLGTEQIDGQAHCVGGGAWTTLEDGAVHYAQSRATRDMVRIVCSYLTQSNSTDSDTTTAATTHTTTFPATESSIPTEPPFIGDIGETEAPPFIETDPILSSTTMPTQSTEPENIITQPSETDPFETNVIALVYDPASNVRATPNGRILCSIDTQRYINIYGHYRDNWYNTDACGSLGVIHISQIQF